MCREKNRGGRESESIQLLSTIYKISSVGIRKAKNESSSHRRGLCVGTKNVNFVMDPSEEFGKSMVSGLGSAHEAS